MLGILNNSVIVFIRIAFLRGIMVSFSMEPYQTQLKFDAVHLLFLCIVNDKISLYPSASPLLGDGTSVSSPPLMGGIGEGA